jgi:aryl-alcohol dehydrogenase-like predicted oxidoreductase
MPYLPKFASLAVSSPLSALQIDALKPIAEKLGCTLAVLCIAWCLTNKNVSTVITGASRPSQVEENLKALDVVDKLTPEVLAEIETAFDTKPAQGYDWGRGTVRWQ